MTCIVTANEQHMRLSGRCRVSHITKSEHQSVVQGYASGRPCGNFWLLQDDSLAFPFQFILLFPYVYRFLILTSMVYLCSP